jgi:parallel beta-helix repeat protein
MFLCASPASLFKFKQKTRRKTMQRLYYYRHQAAKLLLITLSLFALHLSPLAFLQPELLAQPTQLQSLPPRTPRITAANQQGFGHPLITSNAVSSGLGIYISGFALINADTDEIIGWHDPIGHGEFLNLATLPTRHLNIQACLYPEIVGSVRFAFDGNPDYRTDNDAPYALAGESGGDFEAWTPAVGTHTITATPYTKFGASGAAGTPLTITFNVIDTPPPTCTKSLQQMIDDAAPGTVLHVPACIYREKVIINKPITLIADPGAEIRGSEVWTGWIRSGNYWVSVNSAPVFYPAGPCRPGTNERCQQGEQVFFDGKPLLQVTGIPAAGQFSLNNARQVMLADDPTGHEIEVSMRDRWIVGGSDNVTIQGFRMRHCAGIQCESALMINSYSNWVIRDNVLSDAHGVVVGLSGRPGIGRNLQIINNDIFRAGCIGLANAGSEVLIQGNKIHANNTEDFVSFGWGGSGVKIIPSCRNVTFDGNEVYNNNGVGVWFDTDVNDVIVSNNLVHHNLDAGIMYESSDSAKIFNNKVWENGFGFVWVWGAGILLLTTGHAEVYNNVVAWNADGISVVNDNRPGAPVVIENHVHDNYIIKTDDDYGLEDAHGVALVWLGHESMFDSSANNRGAENKYWYPEPEVGYARWRFAWGTMGFYNLSLFNTTSGEENGRYLSQAEVDQVLSSAQIPRLFADAANSDSVAVTFFYKPATTLASAFVPGSFNNWGPNEGGNIAPDAPSRMDFDTTTGRWFKTIKFQVGRRVLYRFNENGAWWGWKRDPLNPHIILVDSLNYLSISNPTIYHLLPNSVSGIVTERQPVISAHLFPSTFSAVDTASIAVKIDDVTYRHVGSGYDAATNRFTFTTPSPLADGLHQLTLTARAFGNSAVSEATTFVIGRADSAEVTFFHKPAGNPAAVYLPGEFNRWQISPATAMSFDSTTNRWFKTVRLRVGGPLPPIPNPGAYRYNFNEDGSRWLRDPLNPRTDLAQGASLLYVRKPAIHYLVPNAVAPSERLNTRRPVVSAYIFPSTNSRVDTASIVVKLDNVEYRHVGAGYDSVTKRFTFTPTRALADGSHRLILTARTLDNSVSSDTTVFVVLAGESPTDSVDVTFYYKPPGNPSVVFVPGEFNNWGPNTNGVIAPDAPSRMNFDSTRGLWVKTVRLRVGGQPNGGVAGAYQYKFNENGASTGWKSDPLNPRKTRDFDNSYLFVRNPAIHYLLPNSVSGVVRESQPVISAYIFSSTTSFVDTASLVLELDGVEYKHVGAGYDPVTKKFTFIPPAPLVDGAHQAVLWLASSINSVNCDTARFTVQAVLVEVTESEELLPRQFALHQNFPNPFNPETKIRFNLPRPTEVRVHIFNLLGEEVVILKQENMPAGTHTLSWDGRNKAGQVAPSGIYFLRVKAGEKVAVKKLLVVR